MINAFAVLALLVQSGVCTITPRSELNGQVVQVVVCPIAYGPAAPEREELAPVDPRKGAPPPKEFDAAPPEE